MEILENAKLESKTFVMFPLGIDLTFQANDLQGARAGWGRGALAGETPHGLFQIVKSPPHSQDSDTQQPNE